MKPAKKRPEKIPHKVEFGSPDEDTGFHMWNGGFGAHCHDYYEFFLITRGGARHVYNGAERILKKNALCFIRPDDVHELYPVAKTECSHINFALTRGAMHKISALLSDETASALILSGGEVFTQLSENDARFFLALADKLNFTADKNAKALLVKAMAVNALAALTAQTAAENVPEWFGAILEKMRTAEFVSLKVADIYRLGNYSHTQIIRYFKKYTGKTPGGYFTEVKLGYACNLLTNTSLSTLQICGSVGFDSLSHFNRIFKKTFAQTPSEYRKEGAPRMRPVKDNLETES